MIETRTGLATQTQRDSEFPLLLNSLANGDVPSYIRDLRNMDETSHLWQELLQALTINETYFMREKSHFDLISAHILPQLIEQRRAENNLHLNVWSVGCATGEEPYSVAITLKETLPNFDQWTVRIIGTDINMTAIKAARRGIYRNWSFRHTSEDFQTHYFQPAPDGLLIRPEIRKLVTFRHANLLSPPPLSQVDIILCRNVLLYFSPDSARQAEIRFFDTLSPGGWLVMGQAEGLHDDREKWITHLFPGTPIYQKPAIPPARDRDSLPSITDIFHEHSHFPDAMDTQTLRRVKATYDMALQAIHDEDYPRAEMILIELIEHHPRNAPMVMMLALVYANRQDVKHAQLQLGKALEIDPLLADAHYLRGTLFIEQGEQDEAQKAFHATLYCQRNHPLASFLLGNLYAQQGDIPKATKFWENVLTSVGNLQADSPVSSISDMTAGRLQGLVSEQLNGWRE